MDEPQPTSTQEAVVASWTPPPVTNFKVNVDGAIFSEQRAVGIGVVVRDDQGRVAATISKRINEHLGAVEAEAKAFEAGLQFAKDSGLYFGRRLPHHPQGSICSDSSSYFYGLIDRGYASLLWRVSLSFILLCPLLRQYASSFFS